MVATSPYGYSAPPPDPTAVVGRRIGAFFIDAVIASVVGFLIFFAMADRVSLDEAIAKYNCEPVLLERVTGGARYDVRCPDKLVITANNEVWVASRGPVIGLGVLLSFAYFALLPGLTGWTFGKLIVGIRVVDASGAIAGVGRNALRWLLFAVDGFFTLFIAGLVTFLVSKGHRRVGDMAAGTFVVSARSMGTAPLAPQPAYGAYTPPMPGPPSGPPPGAATGFPPATSPGYPAGPPGGAPAPVWDPARNTYLQWDPQAGHYLQWDPLQQRWKPIDT